MASALSSSSSSSHHMMCPALSSIPASFARIRFHSLRRVPPLPFPSRRSLPPRRKYPFSSTRAPSLSITSLAQGSHVKKVTAKELDAILDGKRDCPVVVDFYATWCGPCVLLSQELELAKVSLRGFMEPEA